MQLWWKSRPKTSGPEHERAVARSSREWAGEIERLQGELAAERRRHSRLVEDAGRAHLDGSPALVADLSSAVVRSEAAIRSLEAALRTAEDRQADAERDEQRRRLTLEVRRYLALVAEYAEGEAAYRESQLAAIRAAEARDRLPLTEIGALRDRLIRHGVPVLEDVVAQGRGYELIRADVERLRQLAEVASVGPDGRLQLDGEAVDPAALPLTARERRIAEHERQQPEADRRARLRDLEADIGSTGRALAHAQFQRNRADVERYRARLAELEAELAALTEGTAA
jgi:hypothetical protein